ncbi:MAG: LCP family protein [Syntrophomonadaceae bacterium]|jgi:LCP family protein required for cell wall assembly
MKKLLKWTLIIGLVFGAFFGIGAGLTSLIQSAHTDKVDKEPVQSEEEKYPDDGERTNILVLGVDARPGEDNSRSDTMLLVSIDPKLDKVAVISIPRDTRIEVNGYPEKICAANFIGGPGYAVEKVEDLMKLNIDHYVEVDFKGFEKIIDILGGVTVDVPQRMYKPSEGINLQPGKQQKLDGKKALAFVRFRDYVNGDIERTHQQQVFIKALANEVLQARTITRLPGIIKEVKDYVKTDIGFKDMLKMASWAPGFNSDSVIAQTLPGCFYDEVDGNGNLLKSYWLADEDEAANLLANLFEGKTVAEVQQSPPPKVVGPAKTLPSTDDNITSEEENTSIANEGNQLSPTDNNEMNLGDRENDRAEEKPDKGEGQTDNNLNNYNVINNEPTLDDPEQSGGGTEPVAGEGEIPAGETNPLGPEGYI